MVEFFTNMFAGNPAQWGGGVAHLVLILSLVIAFGVMLGKIKIAGISFGVTLYRRVANNRYGRCTFRPNDKPSGSCLLQ